LLRSQKGNLQIAQTKGDLKTMTFLLGKSSMIVASALLASLALTACGKEGTGNVNPNPTEPQSKVEDNKPVTVSMYIHASMVDDADLNKYFIEPLKAKLPHVTLDVVRDGKGFQVQEVLASGSFPDLIVTSNPNIPVFQETSLVRDISSLVKSHNIDLNGIDPTLVDAIKMNSPTGELYGLPFRQNLGVLMYNQDIFDKFGVWVKRRNELTITLAYTETNLRDMERWSII
jgi:multiple sugar transport system substrate-binding protein